MSGDQAMNKPLSFHRRGALVAVAAGAGIRLAWLRIARHFVGAFDFEPLDDLKGFRRITAGETSAMPLPFFRLDVPDAPDETIPESGMRADLSQAC